MFKKMLLINFCASLFWALLGVSIWALGFVIDLPEAQFWALMCLINFGPFFLGLSLTAAIGAGLPFSEEGLKQSCRLCPCTGKYLPKEMNFMLNGIVYSLCGACLYATGMGGTLNGLGRYIMRGETNIDPLSVSLVILGSAMIIIGLNLIRFFTEEAYQQAVSEEA